MFYDAGEDCWRAARTSMEARSDAELMGRIAEWIWSLGRVNPIDWEIRTPVGTFSTDDRATWRTESGEWTAELRRSKKGQHWYLALFEHGKYRGRYDNTGWHVATDRKKVRQIRSYQLPLAA
jgi:hypothetical protein